MPRQILVCLAALFSTALAQKAPAPSGDVFSTSGAKDDRRKYVSKDGRFFDRCAYETDHMGDNPYTKQYGPPDHVPLDREIMSHYVRCAVDACAVNQKAVCWGKKSKPGDQRSFVINCRQYGANQLICENLPANCTATGKRTMICDAGPPEPRPPVTPPSPVQPPPIPPPPGAVRSGDPDAPDASLPGFVGSFPGTKDKCGSFCYSYLWERGIWNVNPGPTIAPNEVGHADPPIKGDVAVIYQRVAGSPVYQPMHFAVYEDNGLFYQRNGSSSVEVVTKQFFDNYSNAIVRYVTPTPSR